MLTTDEIEHQLGVETVARIEKSVMAAFAMADQAVDQGKAVHAVQYLLLSILAASVITPGNDANVERARVLASELVDLVEAVMADQRRSMI